MKKGQIDTDSIDWILWMQNETPITPETFLVNGAEPTSRERRNDLFNWLTTGWFTHEWREGTGWKEWKENEIKQNKPISQNLLFLKGKSHYLIQGCVKEIDESGRKMPYIFCWRNRETILDEIQDTIKSLGRTVNEADLHSICNFLKDKQLKEKKKRRIILLAIGLIALIIIILIISFLNAKYWKYDLSWFYDRFNSRVFNP